MPFDDEAVLWETVVLKDPAGYNKVCVMGSPELSEILKYRVSSEKKEKQIMSDRAGKKKSLIMISTTAMLALVMALAMVLTGCGSGGGTDLEEDPGAQTEPPLVEIDYGVSEIYSEEDIDAAIALINEEFKGWDGCVMRNIRYAGDEVNNAENVAWLNEIAKEKPDGDYTDCIEFFTDFHSPVDSEEAGAWEPDTDYNDYQWWLGRADGSDWTLISWGY